MFYNMSCAVRDTQDEEVYHHGNKGNKGHDYR